MNKSKAGAALGKLGGSVTAKRGSQYFRDIAAKSHAARRANKAKRLAESK